MAKAVKQKNGKWKIRVYNYTDDNGKVHVKSFTADTKKECEYLASEFAFNKKEKKISNNTVGCALNEYIKNKSSILSPSTYRSYNIYLNKNFDELKYIKIKDLTQNTVQSYVNKLSTKYAPKSVHNIYRFLTAALKPYNITFNIMLPQKRKTELSIPTEAELNNILEAVKNTKMEVPVILAAFMGMRRSEICALKWSDIDFNNATLKINKAVVVDQDNVFVVKTTKTVNSTRTLKIPEIVLNKLKEKEQINEYVSECNLNVISKTFSRMLKKHNIKHFRFHDLRHYNASVMLALGVPDKYAMEIMGHSTNNMLKTVYQHTMAHKRSEINSVLDNYFSNNF